MKYLKLKTLGTESVIVPPLSPHHANNFETAVKVKDIFKDYKRHLPKRRIIRNGKRPIKRRIIYNKEIYKVMPLRIFNASIKYIVLGIINGLFRVKLPGKKGYIELADVINKAKYFKRYGLDPLEQNKKAFKVLLTYKDIKCNILISKKYRDILHENIREKDLNFTIKEISLSQIAKKIHKQLYPKLDVKEVYYIILHGFKYICAGLINKVDTAVFSTNGKGKGVDQIFFKISKNKTDRLAQFTRKTRFLYYMEPLPYSGYYYARLSHEAFNNFTKNPTTLKLFLYLEEALSEPLKYPHIFRIKVQKPLFKKINIYREINYEKNNTKYIWRWNGQRFESVDNSQLRFN